MSLSEKKSHYNRPQIEAYAVAARQTGVIAGRGTGKSLGMTAPYIHRNLHLMPRSSGGLLGPSYSNVVSKIIPEIKLGWEKLGFFEEIHYVIGQKPPKNWPLAHRFPSKAYQHFISSITGAGFFVLSGDRAVNNGATMDWLAIEEIRLLKQSKFVEVVPAVRGHSPEFGHLSAHKSTFFVTDMPKRPEEYWVLDLIKENNSEAVRQILMIEQQMLKWRAEINEKGESRQRQIRQYYREAEEALNELRKNLSHLVTADTLDNIHALGIDQIEMYRRTLPEFDFITSVLNRRPNKVQDAFYAAFNDATDDSGHTYDALSDEIVDKYGLLIDQYERDCSWDTDLDLDKPLSVGFDYNHTIRCAVVGQRQGMIYRLLHDFHQLPKPNAVPGANEPSGLELLVKQICRYYRFHRNKRVKYFWDSTAKQGRNAHVDFNFWQSIEQSFKKFGWSVELCYTGAPSTYRSRHEVWETVLHEADDRFPRLRVNRENCADLIISINSTRAGVDRKGRTKKIKTDEGNVALNQLHTTHMAEAADNLIMGDIYGLAKRNEQHFVQV